MQDNRQSIRDWFDIQKPELPTQALVVGFALLAVGLLLSAGGQPSIGLLVAAGGTVLVVVKLQGHQRAKQLYLHRPATEQVLHWLDEDFARLKEQSLAKFGLSPSELIRESVIIAGPADRGPVGGSEWRRPVDEEDPTPRYLYRAWEVTVAHFTRAVMMLYGCHYDWSLDSRADEKTQSIGYEHLVSIGSETDASGKGAVVLSLSNGKSTSCSYAGPDLRAVNETQLKVWADAAVQAMHSAKRNCATVKGQPQTGVAPNFCMGCGHRLEAQGPFCPNCGMRVQR